MHKGVLNANNATIVQNDVIMGRCIKCMNMVIGAQCEYVIMRLMVGNAIMMYHWYASMLNKLFLTPFRDGIQNRRQVSMGDKGALPT